jgi:hypothetical protein
VQKSRLCGLQDLLLYFLKVEQATSQSRILNRAWQLHTAHAEPDRASAAADRARGECRLLAVFLTVHGRSREHRIAEHGRGYATRFEHSASCGIQYGTVLTAAAGAGASDGDAQVRYDPQVVEVYLDITL